MKYVLFLFSVALFSFGAIHASDNKEPKTLVLIICSDDLPLYHDLQKVWQSYMHDDPNHFECYFIRADEDLSSEIVIDGDVIWSRGIENPTPGILNKTLHSLQALESRLDEFDYVLRANLSSFFVFERLLTFLKSAPKERFYCGLHHGQDTPEHERGWVNGSGIIMSIDLAKLLLENRDGLFDLSPTQYNADDVAIADLFAKNEIEIYGGPIQDIYTLDFWLQYRDNIPNEILHFKIKTDPPTRHEIDRTIHADLLHMFYNKTILFDDELPETDMKILILIIASDNLPVYIEEQKVWRAYMHLFPKNVEAYFIKSDQNLDEPIAIKGDVIWSRDVESVWPGVLNKTILSFELLHERLHEFNYAIRTNLSSFYVIPRLLKFLETLPKERCYAGYSIPGWTFVNGHNIIMSTDLVEMLLQHKYELLDSPYDDDRHIGAFFHYHQIPMLYAPYFDICQIDPWWNSKSSIKVCTPLDWVRNKYLIPSDVFLFRTKNHPHLRATDEVFHMQELLKMFYGLTPSQENSLSHGEL